MKRFIIYRCPENCSCHRRLKEHQLIGAACGYSIEDAMKEICEQIKDDISSLVHDAFADGTLDIIDMNEEENSRRYDWSLTAVFSPDNLFAPGNTVREYAIAIKDEDER